MPRQESPARFRQTEGTSASDCAHNYSEYLTEHEYEGCRMDGKSVYKGKIDLSFGYATCHDLCCSELEKSVTARVWTCRSFGKFGLAFYQKPPTGANVFRET